MKTIILCGYRRDDDVETAPGLATLPDGTLLIDQSIDRLRAIGHEVICVLAGPSADELIRRSRRLHDVDLVFDTNGEDVSLLTNVRAGLVAVGPEPCFALPVEVAAPERPVWTRLWHLAHAADRTVSFAQLFAGDDPRDSGFPMLITRFGNAELGRLPDVESLADARLEYLRSPI